jgi:hypothetical protein
MSEKLCINCFNSRLAKQKKDLERLEREKRIKEEQLALSQSKRMAELEAEAIFECRKQMREEAEVTSRELEKRFQERRKVPKVDLNSPGTSGFLSEVEEARRKYRQELLEQINEKKKKQEEEKSNEIRIERQRIEEAEEERQRLMNELFEESRTQRENYKNTLLMQVKMKNDRVSQEEQRKMMEKIQMDEMVQRYRDSRFGFSVCEGCSQRM